MARGTGAAGSALRTREASRFVVGPEAVVTTLHLDLAMAEDLRRWPGESADAALARARALNQRVATEIEALLSAGTTDVAVTVTPQQDDFERIMTEQGERWLLLAGMVPVKSDQLGGGEVLMVDPSCLDLASSER